VDDTHFESLDEKNTHLTIKMKTEYTKKYNSEDDNSSDDNKSSSDEEEGKKSN
jgi:hypothetical protein